MVNHPVVFKHLEPGSKEENWVPNFFRGIPPMAEASPRRPDHPIVPHRRVSLVAFEEHSNSAQTMARSPCLGKQAPQGSKARGLATGWIYLLNDLTTVRMRLCGICKQVDSGQKNMCALG